MVNVDGLTQFRLSITQYSVPAGLIININNKQLTGL